MLKPLLRLLPYLREHALAFWLGMAGLLGARVFEALIPIFVKQGVDRIDAGRKAVNAGTTTLDGVLDTLVEPALFIILCVFAQMAVTIVSRTLIRQIGMRVAYQMRNQMYDHLQRMGPQFFGKHSIGDLMARAINDIGLVRMVVAGASRMTFVLIFTAIVGIAFMFSLSVPLTLALLLPMPIITLVAHYYGKKIYTLSHVVQEGFSTLSTFVQENLNGIRTVQAMAQEDEEVQRFSAVNQKYADDNLALFTNSSLLTSWMPTLAAVCMLIIIGYGSHLVETGEMSLGTLVAFFSYLAMVLWPVREAGTIITQWQRGASACQRLFEILDYEPEIQDRPSDAYPEVSGLITLDHVTYRYADKETAAIDDVSFEIKPGEMIAILGRVGSGKSTLLRLLVRLLEPTEGRILLDGHPVDQFPLAKLREQVCMVLQDPFLFADSLGENIAYDNPGRRSDEIRESAQAAALEETINRLPAGLETVLGERGVTLSGGQKQRTALARGLIRGTPILILDDCFSAVDTETEEKILSGLKAMRANRTTLIVSHRVSTARHADRILVLDEGRIIETGTHRALLEAGGFYADLEQAQSQKGHLINRLDRKGGTS